MAKYPRELEPHEVQWIVDDALHSYDIDKSLKKIEFNRREWNAYMKAHPDVKEAWEQALLDACPFLENELLNCHKRLSTKEAQIFSSNVMKILAARQPERYGNKLDLSVKQTISIKSNLDKANDRLATIFRDVQPIAIEIAAESLTEKKEK